MLEYCRRNRGPCGRRGQAHESGIRRGRLWTRPAPSVCGSAHTRAQPRDMRTGSAFHCHQDERPPCYRRIRPARSAADGHWRSSRCRNLDPVFAFLLINLTPWVERRNASAQRDVATRSCKSEPSRSVRATSPTNPTPAVVSTCEASDVGEQRQQSRAEVRRWRIGRKERLVGNIAKAEFCTSTTGWGACRDIGRARVCA